MENRIIFLIILFTGLSGAIIINLFLFKINVESNTENIEITNSSINFNSLTLKQKLAQMIIIRGDEFNEDYTKLNIGGIFLDDQDSLENYKKLIEEYQNSSKIKLFVATDFEGAWSPFSKSNITDKEFPKFSDIKNSEEAYEIGLKQGELLKGIGFNLNLAPVAELEDFVYGGRVFSGTDKEIREKLKKYISGLQQNVLGTCKHYPGKGMVGNTHLFLETQEITSRDLELFETCFEENISAIMVGHQKIYGVLNSLNKQASISPEIINSIDDNFLIISDEVNMWGLKLSYLLSKKKMYIDLINAGENIILDFNLSPRQLNNLINHLEKNVGAGRINEEKINNSVKKILKKKGYEINSS